MVNEISKKNLIPFKKGQSGNPSGYPTGLPNASTRFRNLLSTRIKGTNPITGEDGFYLVSELMDAKLFQLALKGDLGAIKEVLDRVEGRVTQSIETTINIDPVMVDFAQEVRKEIEDAEAIRKTTDGS